jgi:hypothetical protein
VYTHEAVIIEVTDEDGTTKYVATEDCTIEGGTIVAFGGRRSSVITRRIPWLGYMHNTLNIQYI